MNENDLVDALIEYYSKKSGFAEEQTECEIEQEAHYNYYGDRGVADLFVRDYAVNGPYRAVLGEHVFEIKSAAALAHETGANSILRQFNRMRRYFFRDENRHVKKAPQTDVGPRFELCFVPSEDTLRHVIAHADQYVKAEQQNAYAGAHEGRSLITFRYPDPENIQPAHIKGRWFPQMDWLDHVETANEKMVDAFGDAITELKDAN